MEKLIKELKKELQFTLYFPKEGVENPYGFGFPGTMTLPLIMNASPDVIMITNLAVTNYGNPPSGLHQNILQLTTNYCSGFIMPDKWEEVKDLYYPVEAKLLTEHLTRQIMLFEKPIYVVTLAYPLAKHQLKANTNKK